MTRAGIAQEIYGHCLTRLLTSILITVGTMFIHFRIMMQLTHNLYNINVLQAVRPC